MHVIGKPVFGIMLGLSLCLAGPALSQDAAPDAEPGQADAAPANPNQAEYEGELVEGQFFVPYYIEAQAGHHVIVNLRSTEFDTYLSLVAPDGTVSFNDDWNQTNKHSHVHIISEQGGRYEIRVAAFSIDQTGPYKLDVFTGAESPDGSMPPIIESGALAEGDDELKGAPGRFIDRFPIEALAGQHLSIELTSWDFDTFLILESADGSQRWENDDFRERQDMSFLSLTMDSPGTYTLSVTSFEAKESGDYNLTVRRGAPPPQPVNLRTERHEGELGDGDETRAGNEFIDRYEFEGKQGEQVTIDLRSTSFDTYLLLQQVGGEQQVWENDDFETGNTNHSQVLVTLPSDGVYAVLASSYDPGESGKYQLIMSHLPPRDDQIIEGELAEGDPTRPFGEHVDWIELPTEPGQTIEVRLTSEAFDTLLIFESPTGLRTENDDWNGSSSESRVEVRILEPGVHRIGVSSFDAGQTGAYAVDILLTPAVEEGIMRAVIDLAAGDQVQGELMYGDATMDYGELTDRYRFSATAGQQIVIDLKSGSFDTFLKIIAPDGSEQINDDFDGQGHSRITFTAEQTGTYRLFASSFDADVTGQYTLDLQMNQPADTPLPEIPARRVYGIFIGITDYGGLGDLPYSADDASTLHRSLRDQFGMRAEDAIVLLDQKATVENVEAAVTKIVQQASADDTVVIFYSGHGGQIERDDFNAQDPDAKDETICMVDGDITDDRFAELLAPLRAGTTLIMFDACYAGGFAKDLISAPGRMGLFSSEEDVLSMVAAKFEAGGYMSMFVREALGENRDDADLNKDKMLTAHELSHYVAKRYQEVVQQPKPLPLLVEGAEVNPGTDLSFQKLVSDRGGVSPNHVILSWD